MSAPVMEKRQTSGRRAYSRRTIDMLARGIVENAFAALNHSQESDDAWESYRHVAPTPAVLNMHECTFLGLLISDKLAGRAEHIYGATAALTHIQPGSPVIITFQRC